MVSATSTFLFACCLAPLRAADDSQKPHVLLILVDDLGWGNVGFNQGTRDDEVQTPALDALVHQGLHLTRHYVHPSCTPTRSSLQSGRLPVHVTVGLRNPESPNAGVPRNMTCIAEKMQQGGYKTHFVGKWDVGMATPKHTPRGRGYGTALGYFEHKNDFWTQGCYQSQCCEAKPGQGGKHYDLPIVDLWIDDGDATPEGGRGAVGLNGTDYEEFIFERRLEHIVDAHDPKDPLFVFYAPHAAHCPIQAPADYLEKFAFIDDDEGECRKQTSNVLPVDPPNYTFSCRRTYRAMVNLLDGVVGRVVERFKAKGMWDDLLIVFSSDNGGPLELAESASTNHPLRGGKYSYFEGGVKAAAFASGGFIPEVQRGKKLSDVMHIADWYTTLAALAGVSSDDVLAAQSGLPPVDGVNLWPLLSGKTSISPRTDVVLSANALVSGRWKLLLGNQGGGFWQGPRYPNASTIDVNPVLECGDDGCLFDVDADPNEYEDVRDKHPAVVSELKLRLAEDSKHFFDNSDTGVDSCPPDVEMPCACWMAMNHYGGFFGPYQEVPLKMSGVGEELI